MYYRHRAKAHNRVSINQCKYRSRYNYIFLIQFLFTVGSVLFFFLGSSIVLGLFSTDKYHETTSCISFKAHSHRLPSIFICLVANGIEICSGAHIPGGTHITVTLGNVCLRVHFLNDICSLKIYH